VIRRFSAVLGFGLFLASPPTAWAQDSAAAAEVLFGEARALAEKGDFAAACPKYEESQKVDPGMGTLYRLGDCYEHIGRTASAWAAFRDVASQAQTAGQAAREADARQRAAAIESQLSRMTIDVPKALPGVVVERDGVHVGEAQWGLAVPVDPGAHTVIVHAPGKREWKKVLDVPRKEAIVLHVPPLEDAPPEPSKPDGPRAPNDAKDGQRGGSSQKTVGLIVGGVGVASLGVSAVFGLLSMGHKSVVDENCLPVNGCNTKGASASVSAVHTGNASTGFFVAGAVLVAGGVVLFVTAPRSPDATKPRGAARLQATPMITPSAAGALVGGTW
jgi:hypothetical protein